MNYDLEDRLRDAFAGRAETSHVEHRADPVPSAHVAEPSRGMWVGVAGAAAAVTIVIAGLALLVRPTSDETPSLAPPPDTTANSSPETNPTAPGTMSPSTTESAATTGAVDETTDSELVGRTWVRVPTDDPYHYQYELELSFPNTTSVTGYDGCNAWNAEATFTQTNGDADPELGQVYAADLELPPAGCVSEQQLMVSRQIAVGEDRLQLLDASGAADAVYVAVDTLEVPQLGDLVGAWTTRSGSRLELLADGSARLGACAPAGTWNYQDGQLRLAGFDTAPAETAACSGGQILGTVRGLTPDLAEGTVTADITTTGTDLLVRLGERALWLQPTGPISPLDLESSTAYGFGPFTDISAEFIIDTVTAIAGPPTFDTGWSTIAPTDNGDTADCSGGLGQRIVFWNDIRFGFFRGGFEPDGDRLYMVGAGNFDQDAPLGLDGALPDQPATPTIDAQTVGPGSSVAEFDAGGYPIRDGFYLEGGARRGQVIVTDDVITGVEYRSNGFC